MTKRTRTSLDHMTPEEKAAYRKAQVAEATKRRDERKKAEKLGLTPEPLLVTKCVDDQERKDRHAAREKARREEWKKNDPEGYREYERKRGK